MRVFTLRAPILLILLLGGDYLVKRLHQSPGFRSLIDVFIHGLIALVIASPLGGAKVLLPAFISGTLLDLDHLVMAKSWRISDAVSLKHRPYTHSITFAVVVGLLVWTLTKLGTLGLAVGVAIASHVLRDASSEITFVLWPSKINIIPYWTYILIEIAILWSFCLWESRII